MTMEGLAAFNAAMNATSLCALVTGYVFIKRGRREAHKRAMLLATAVSAVFLVGYVARKAIYGDRPFPADNPWKPYYLVFLGVHLLLAMVNVPLIVVALRRAFRGDLAGHRRISRVLFPSWVYVSASGVAIYFMLY
jgi:putative membrane protein